MSRLLLRPRPLHLHHHHQLLKPTTTTYRASSTFSRGPAPPRLPPDQQAEFERLLREATVSSAFQEYAEDTTAPSSSASSSETPAPVAAVTVAATSTSSTTTTTNAQGVTVEPPNPVNPTISSSEGDTMHPAYVRGAPPEFEGDVNPRTGEVGGPKREPLRWGADGDWSYNGRVTDF